MSIIGIKSTIVAKGCGLCISKSSPLTSRKQINNVVSSHKPQTSSVAPCKVIQFPGFSKKDLFNAAIGPNGIIHKQLVQLTKVKKT